MKRVATGFTLIELVIAVAVIAILAAVAYPSYTRHVARSHRSQAQGYLMRVAQRQQQFFLDSRDYAAQAAIFSAEPVPAEVAEQYQVAVGPATPTTPPTFIVTATPRAGSLQAAYREPALSIAQDGSKSPSGAWQ
jgi:type IV pilus assembly protein PilE